MIEETPLPQTPEGCTGQSIQEAAPAPSAPPPPAAPETPPVIVE